LVWSRHQNLRQAPYHFPELKPILVNLWRFR
jgi:hypothetical protein